MRRIKNSGCTIKRLIAILALQIEEFKYCLIGFTLPDYSSDLDRGDNFMQILGNMRKKMSVKL